MDARRPQTTCRPGGDLSGSRLNALPSLSAPLLSRRAREYPRGPHSALGSLALASSHNHGGQLGLFTIDLRSTGRSGMCPRWGSPQ